MEISEFQRERHLSNKDTFSFSKNWLFHAIYQDTTNLDTFFYPMVSGLEEFNCHSTPLLPPPLRVPLTSQRWCKSCVRRLPIDVRCTPNRLNHNGSLHPRCILRPPTARLTPSLPATTLLGRASHRSSTLVSPSE